jgi:hypothetical protein
VKVKNVHKFLLKNFQGTHHLGNTPVNDRIILKSDLTETGCVDWNKMVQYTVQWKAFVDTAINTWVL